jgi:beta-lactamase superfamily II metal-dependent hydrolase
LARCLVPIMARHGLIAALLFAFALATAPSAAPAQTPSARTLDIYFIDVDGGQATLIVFAGGETLLVDAGYPSTGTFASRAQDAAKARDPQRILQVAKLAGVTRIDYLLVTHYHADHAGGVPELAKLMPIDAFVDHGALSGDADRVAGTSAIHDAYLAVRATGRHLQPRPGERLPIKGADVTVVSAAGATLAAPLPGAAPGANAACRPPGIPAQETTENPLSLGFLLQFGKFRFLDVGDLTGAPLFDLACPSDRLGPVDVYLVTHHGGADAADPALFRAVNPRVAILNNGARKGGAPEALEMLRALPQTETWQLHRAEINGAVNVAEEFIANLDDRTAHWIRISASEDGSFAVTNPRTGVTKRYGPR